MKRSYEDRYRILLPRRTYTIIRIGGRAFHAFTRQYEKPYDARLAADMDRAAVAVCEDAQGVQFAYGQSDEYSFLLTDFAQLATETWFDGNLQKVCSIVASIFTAEFMRYFSGECRRAHFDCRVFVIPDPIEVENYFIWRQQDATRNAILALAQSEFPPKQIHGLGCDELQEKLFRERGINFNDRSAEEKRGRVVIYKVLGSAEPLRGWLVDRNIPIFTAERDYLIRNIPQMETRPILSAAVNSLNS